MNQNKILMNKALVDAFRFTFMDAKISDLPGIQQSILIVYYVFLNISCMFPVYNKIPSIIPHVEFWEGGVYADLPLPYKCREGSIFAVY